MFPQRSGNERRLVDISNVALLYRLRQCGDWLALLIGHMLAAAAPKASQGRMIRIIDATAVPKAERGGQEAQRVVAYSQRLRCERFGHFELTDQKEGETFDRIPVVKGEIRIGDRAYLQPDRIGAVLEKGGDCLARAGMRVGVIPLVIRFTDLIAELRKAAARGLIDRPIRTQARCSPRSAFGRD